MLSALCLSTPFALAATLEVGPTASYTTIQAAINAAHSGDTVRIAAGTYQERIQLNGKALTVEGSSDGDTIVDAAGQGSTVRISSTAAGTTTLRHLTLTGGLARVGGGLWAERTALVLDDVRMVGNQAEERGGGAFIAGGSLTGQRLRVEANQAAMAGGIFLDRVMQPVIQTSQFIRNRGFQGAALRIQGNGAQVLSSLFVENGRDQDGAGVVGETSVFLKVGAGSSTHVAQCVFLRAGCCNLIVHGSSGVVVENNIFDGSAGYGVYWRQTLPEGQDAKRHLRVAYNDFHQNAFGDFVREDVDRVKHEQTLAGSNGNLGVDPQFEDAGALGDDGAVDVHLSPTSPCRDTGRPGTAVSDVDGTRSDLGLYGGPLPMP